MHKQDIGENTGIGDRSAADIFCWISVRMLRLVDREPYDDEDIFGGIIAQGWSECSSPQLAGIMDRRGI